MKIVHIITTLSPGGAENQVLSLARGQVAAGHEVRVVYLKGEGSLEPHFLKAGCAAVTKVRFERPHQILSSIYGLVRHVRSSAADIVHTHLLKANTLGGIAARLAGGKRAVVATEHNGGHHRGHRLFSWLHGQLSRMCDDHVIAISDHVAEFVHLACHTPQTKITRIYNGFDQQHYSKARPVNIRREFDLPTDSFVFGVVGRVTEQKNQMFLVRTFAKLAPKCPRIRLLIVGGVGYTNAYYERVKREIGRLGLTRLVVMTGWRTDAFSVIGGLDCMLMPSTAEGLGMVVLEAIVQGVPVIAARDSALPEVVRHGVDGLLVEPGEATALITAMEEMIRRQAEFAAQARTGGPRYITEKFSLPKMLAETRSVYEVASARARR